MQLMIVLGIGQSINDSDQMNNAANSADFYLII